MTIVLERKEDDVKRFRQGLTLQSVFTERGGNRQP